MRALLGPVVVHGALLAAGLGVLRVVGLVPAVGSRRALAAGGLAYLVGVVTTLSLCLIVLVLGGPFDLPVFAAVAAALASPLLWWRRRASLPSLATNPRAGRAAVGAVIVALVALAVLGLFTVGNRPFGLLDVDAWNQWTRKALLLVGSSHLPAAIFSFSGDLRYMPHYNINPSYPLLLPLLEALHMRALGRADPSSVHVTLWLLAIAFAWAGAFIASRVTAAVVWAPVLAAAALLSLPRLMSGYADVPLGYYMALGTLALGVWLQTRRRGDLAVAVLLLAGAAQTKDEGTAGAFVVLLAALAVVALAPAQPRPGARELVIAAVLLIVIAVLPWRLWVATHGLQTDDPLGRIADPVYLIDNIGRVGRPLSAIAGQLTSLSGVTLFVPIGLAIVAVAIWERRGRMLGAFYLAAGVGYVIALVWSYWISIFPLSFLIPTTEHRVVLPLGLLAAAPVLHLSKAEPA